MQLNALLDSITKEVAWETEIQNMLRHFYTVPIVDF